MPVYLHPLFLICCNCQNRNVRKSILASTMVLSYPIFPFFFFLNLRLSVVETTSRGLHIHLFPQIKLTYVDAKSFAYGAKIKSEMHTLTF